MLVSDTTGALAGRLSAHIATARMLLDRYPVGGESSARQAWEQGGRRWAAATADLLATCFEPEVREEFERALEVSQTAAHGGHGARRGLANGMELLSALRGTLLGRDHDRRGRLGKGAPRPSPSIGTRSST